MGIRVTVDGGGGQAGDRLESGGRYIPPLQSLQAGRYTIVVAAQGFKTTTIADRVVETAQPAHVDIKLELGSAYKTDSNRQTMEIKGRDLVSGIPKTLILDDDEVRESLSDPVSQILNGIKQALENTPPELSADIVDKGIVLAGGGALLKGMDVFLREETSLPIIIAEDPLTCVVLGAGKVLDDEDILQKVRM